MKQKEFWNRIKAKKKKNKIEKYNLNTKNTKQSRMPRFCSFQQVFEKSVPCRILNELEQ